ncbi:MAG: HD domain-containing protein [Solirubrobacterales bacterium]|nr:HD domain-containing protein [Solirubrobacterales bacterium]
MHVRQLRIGDPVTMALMVRNAKLRPPRDGTQLLRLTLSDRTGCVNAIVLEPAEEALQACRAGEVVLVVGAFELHERYGARIVIESVRAAAGDEYDPHEVIDGPARSPKAMEADLRELIATIQDPHLADLLEVLLGAGTDTWRHFAAAPAAKHYHQAYRHGLMEHALTVAQAVSAISATFPGIDRDVAVTGALLHDIGKLDAYAMTADTIEMTDHGRLFGEIACGFHRVRTAIDGLSDFPTQTAQSLLHIILSHHGSLEHGSPVVPATREATLVHMADNLGGRLGSFDRLEKALPTGERWAPYDKGIGGGAYFAEPAAPQVRAA